MLLEQERRVTALEDALSEIRAHIETHPAGYYTIAGYASLRGVNVDITIRPVRDRLGVQLLS